MIYTRQLNHVAPCTLFVEYPLSSTFAMFFLSLVVFFSAALSFLRSLLGIRTYAWYRSKTMKRSILERTWNVTVVRQKSGGIASSVELAISHDMVGLVIVCSYFLRKTINYSKILVTKRLTGRLQTSQCDPYNDISRTVCVPRAVCKTIIH